MKEKTFLEKTGLFVFGLIFAIPIVMLSGKIVMDLWAWFIVPIFEIHSITYAQALGFSLIVSYLSKNPKGFKHDEEEGKEFKILGYHIARMFLVWGLGYIIHLFV